MKYWYISLLLLLLSCAALADDKYTNKIYSSATLSYWCAYNKIPTSKEEITKVANIDFSDTRLTIDLDEWLDLLSYEIDDDVMTITTESTVITDGKTQSSLTLKFSSKCFSRKIPKVSNPE